MAWTDERVEDLKRLWADGLSCSQIAGRLGGVTRNAVIGKLSRLRLPGRATTVRLKSSRKPVKRPQPKHFTFITSPNMVRQVQMEPAPLPVVEELVIPLNERKTVQTLEDKDCRWPIGHPGQPDFHFCGKLQVPGLSYCEVHMRRAFQPPKPRQLPDNVIMLPKRETVAA